jgi:hypothetical protein
MVFFFKREKKPTVGGFAGFSTKGKSEGSILLVTE